MGRCFGHDPDFFDLRLFIRKCPLLYVAAFYCSLSVLFQHPIRTTKWLCPSPKKRLCIAINKSINKISQKNSRNLWKETSRVRNNACCNTNCIDGITGDVEISKHFAEKYNDLYNSVTSDKHSLDDIFNVNLQEISTI